MSTKVEGIIDDNKKVEGGMNPSKEDRQVDNAMDGVDESNIVEGGRSAKQNAANAMKNSIDAENEQEDAEGAPREEPEAQADDEDQDDE